MDKYTIDENYFLIINVGDGNKLKITEELIEQMKYHIFSINLKSLKKKK